MSENITGRDESASAVSPLPAGLEASPAKSPDHLVWVDGGSWPLWRWVCLRGAGFPVELVLALADQEAATAADDLLRLEEESRRARERSAELVSSALDALRAADAWDDRPRRDPLVKALRALRMNKTAALTGLDADADAAIEALRIAAGDLGRSAQDFEQAYEAAQPRVSRAIREAASAADFQEAVIWQNRNAFHVAVAPYVRQEREGGARGSKQRQIEELIANYLQRYCVKNDTIGFFGPVGWAQLTTEGEGITAQPGPKLLAERSVYLEVWCLDELAKTLARDEAMRPWIAPRRASYIDIVGTTLYLPSKNPIKLPAAHAALLNACDGHLSAKEIARSLLRNPYLKLKDEAEVYSLIELLVRQGLVVCKLEVPIESHPETSLRRVFERIEDESLRERAVAALEEMERARLSVERATGDPVELDRSVGHLEESFTHLTGSAPTRSSGEMYAGRTLVYEDCRRDLKVEVGPEVVAALGAPLSLLLTSARWLTNRVAAMTRDIFMKIYTDIARRTNSRVVDFPSFWFRLSPTIFGEEQKQPVHLLLPSFHERWSKLLSIPQGVRRVEYSSEQLRPGVMQTFAAPDSGWDSALYHSPDVMIAAESAEAIRRGEYLLVLGEMHASVNTLRPALFCEHHPEPGELQRFYELDHPSARGVPIIPKTHWPQKTARLVPVLVSERDYRIEFSPETNPIPAERVLPFGRLVIVEEGGRLIVRTRDGRLRFDPLDIFSDTPTLSVASSFNLLPRRDYTPRMSIDRLVISRETWKFVPAELTFAWEKTGSGRYLAARRWARERGIPRFAFAKATTEIKPVFVDFDSPVYIDNFAKITRRAADTENAQMSVSEMLPAPDQCWLTDAEGRHYTSEFRFVAMDAPRRRGPAPAV